jgi:hypothetical protein
MLMIGAHFRETPEMNMEALNLAKDLPWGTSGHGPLQRT